MKTVSFALFLVLGIGVCQGAAQQEAFTVASESLPPLSEEVEKPPLLLRLKQYAVREYLQKILGPRFERYDALITPEFAEGYILDYSVNRQSADSSQMEISVHLDTRALEDWVRINEAKATGSDALKPLFLISSSLAGLALDPRQTDLLVKQPGVSQLLYQHINEVFGKFNAAAQTTNSRGLGLDRPPATRPELDTLRSAFSGAGFNSAVWVHLSAPPNCLPRIDFQLYNLAQGRLALSYSADLVLGVHDLTDNKKLMKTVGKTIKAFGQGFEESISKGTLFAKEYEIVVEGLSSAKSGYKAFKRLEAVLSRQDFILQCSMSKARSSIAEFRVLSPLSPNELFQRFHVADLEGIKLKPLYVDSRKVTMRYLE